MSASVVIYGACLLLAAVAEGTAAGFESDIIKTSGGDLELVFIGHGTLMFKYNGLVVHVDPVGQYADYSALPQADIILVTHGHRDHLDTAAVTRLRREGTEIIVAPVCTGAFSGETVLKNGDSTAVKGIPVKAVPAYNLVHMRAPGKPYHPRGEGNGYVLTFGDKTVYIAGDTENIPEMKALHGTDIVFLPMNLPYTMTPGMAADAVAMLDPGMVYPYHYGDTDTDELVALLKNRPGCELRIRSLK